MAKTTRVLIRVQANGGKFLGPDIGYSLVSIRDVLSGELLAQGLAAGGSGQLLEKHTPGASQATILTPQPSKPPQIHWLSATPGEVTAGLLAELRLKAPTLVEISASGLTGGVPNGHTVKEQMWLTPGVDLDEEPGVVLLMPGLHVEVLSPSVTSPATEALQVKAWITMMCGCKIATTGEWLPAEFRVSAIVGKVGGRTSNEKVLELESTSTFVNKKPFHLAGPGDYQLTVNAVQPATGNVGSAKTFFTLESSTGSAA